MTTWEPIESHHRTVRKYLFAFVAVTWVVAIVFSIGANIDHIADVRLLQRAYEGWLPVTGLDAPGNYYTQFHPQTVVDSYGYSFSYISHIVTRVVTFIIGAEYGINSQVRIMSQNLLIAALGFLGCVIVGRIVRVVTNSRVAELMGFALLALTPLWAGHSWMNQKDIPFAVGFIACTLVAVHELSRVCDCPDINRYKLPLREEAFYIAVGIVFTFGVRPGLSMLALPLLATLVISRKGLRRPTFPQSLGLLVGTALTLNTNPASVPNPVGWVMSAMQTGRDFQGWNGQVLFFGKFINGRNFGVRELSIEYFFQNPALIWIGVVSAAAFALRSRSREVLIALPLVFHAFVTTALVFTFSENNYSAGRQYLFIVPGLVAVGALGLWRLLHWSSAAGFRVIRIGLAVFAVVLLFDHVMLYPFQYIYRNEAFRVIPDYPNRFEYDYWQVSGRAVASALHDLGPGPIVIAGNVDTTPNIIPYLGPDQSATNVLTPDTIGATWLYYWPPVFAEKSQGIQSRCREFHRETVTLWPKQITMGGAFDCR